MENTWQLQEAKNKFSRLVDLAHRKGPQFVTKHGKESVVVLSIEEYRQITQPKTDLVQFMRQSPLTDVSLEIKRDQSFSRDIEL